jgi:hypothetical protein
MKTVANRIAASDFHTHAIGDSANTLKVALKTDVGKLNMHK